MRICRTCHISKELDDFPWKNQASGKKSHQCKQCLRAVSHAHYMAHKAQYVARARVLNRAFRRRMQDRVWGYLKTHPCVDCGESDPVVLEFDHVRGVKTEAIAVLVSRRMSSWQLIEAEIAKCEVRCANCHRRRTAKQFGWRGDAQMPSPALQLPA